MTAREKAAQIYTDCMDFDFGDYAETADADIDFIADYIARHGYAAARRHFLDMVSQ